MLRWAFREALRKFSKKEWRQVAAHWHYHSIFLLFCKYFLVLEALIW
jgi:hypothetical protein